MSGRSIPYECQKCHTEMLIPRHYAGKKQQCRKCGASFIVPDTWTESPMKATSSPVPVWKPSLSEQLSSWFRKATKVVFIGVVGLVGIFVMAYIMEPSLRYEVRHMLGLKPSRAQQQSGTDNRAARIDYRVVRTESYSAWVDGRFENGAKIHVVTESGRLTEVAREVALGRSERAVTIFFWNSANDVGRTGAVYSLEFIDGKIQ